MRPNEALNANTYPPYLAGTYVVPPMAGAINFTSTPDGPLAPNVCGIPIDKAKPQWQLPGVLLDLMNDTAGSLLARRTPAWRRAADPPPLPAAPPPQSQQPQTPPLAEAALGPNPGRPAAAAVGGASGDAAAAATAAPVPAAAPARGVGAGGAGVAPERVFLSVPTLP